MRAITVSSSIMVKLLPSTGQFCGGMADRILTSRSIQQMKKKFLWKLMDEGLLST